MEKNTTYNHITSIILVFGMIFSFPLAFVDMNIQQYLIIGPIILVYLIELFIIKNKNLKLSQLNIICIIFIIFIAASFKYGFSVSSLIPLFGILLIPVTIIIFSQKSKEFLLQLLLYFSMLFSIYEVMLVINSLYYGYFLSSDYYGVTLFRENISFDWPNYFAMLSALKIGVVSYLRKSGYVNTKLIYIFTAISLITIIGSVSRTAIIMAVIILLVPTIYNILFNSNKQKFIKIVISAALVIGFLLVTAIVFIFKASNSGAALSRTLNARLGRWEEAFDIVTNNPLIGIGFRSTTSFVEGIGSTHNDYVDILLKGGLIFIVIFYGYLARRLFILFKNKEIELFSLICSILVAGFVQNPLKKSTIIILFAIFIALSYITDKWTKERKIAKSKPKLSDSV